MQQVLSWDKFIMMLLAVVAVFFYPFIFAPWLDEAYYLPKLIFLFMVTAALVAANLISFIAKQRLILSGYDLDTPLVFLTLASWMSLLVATPNKFQGLIHSQNGPLLHSFLLIIYYLLSRNQQEFGRIRILDVARFSALILAFFALTSFLSMGHIPMFFTPLGSYLDLSIFLGFFSLYSIKDFILSTINIIKKSQGLKLGTFIILMLKVLSFIVLFSTWLLTLYLIITPQNETKSFLEFAPWHITWAAFLETLKARTLFFGQGIDGFTTIFPLVRDTVFNYSSSWSTNTFSLGSSMLLQTFVELGLLGGASLLWLLAKIIHHSHDKELLMLWICIMIIFFPISPVIWFLLIILAASIANERKGHYLFNLKDLAPIYIAIALVSFLALSGAVYPIAIETQASYYAQQGVDALKNKNFDQAYKLQQQVIKLNPNRAQNQITLSQLSLKYIQKYLETKSQAQKQLTEKEQSHLMQIIDQTIKTSRNAINLNPDRPDYYYNLAQIYTNLMQLTPDAYKLATENYRKALELDPNNPTHYLELGKLYLSQKDFDKANIILTQALGLNQQLASAYYFRGQAHFGNEEYKKAKEDLEIAKKIFKLAKLKEEVTLVEKMLKEVEPHVD